MRTPKRGEAYQVCVHLADEAASAEKHYWRLPRRQWLLLCTACHTSYSKRAAVNVDALLRLFSCTPDLGPSAAEALHVATRNPPRCIPSPTSRPPQPFPPDEFALVMLRLSVQDVTMSMVLPSRSWSLPEVRKRLRSLRAKFQRRRQAHEQGVPSSPRALSQLSEIERELSHIQQRLHVVLRACRRMRALVYQAQRLLARTLSDPFSGYFYRRRIYRKLLRERETLASLLWALNVQDSIFSADLATTMRDTFLALQNRYGMPLSDAAMRRLVANVPLADRLPLASAITFCECRVCLHVRQNAPLDADEELSTVASCPCAFCRFCRTTLPTIDHSQLEHAPAFSGALLALRRRVGGPSSVN